MPSLPPQPRGSSPAPDQIFAGITYHLASSLAPARAEELAFVLDAHGAQAADKELEVKDSKLTTVVSNSVRFEGWEEVSARMEGGVEGEKGVEVVTDKWVERSVILGKLQSGNHFSPDPSLIFSGVVACASDLPSADLEVLSAGITALGGQWRTGLTKDVTHLFALNPGSAKYATAMHYREETGIKVVLPHWFDDAVRLGMGGLDTRPYEWPEPAVLHGAGPPPAGGDGKEKGKGKEKERDVPDVEKDDVKRNMYATAALFTPSMGRSSPPTEADISLVNTHIHGGANGVIGTPGPSTIKSGVQVWHGRKILLSRTLQLYGNRREAVQIGIERAGGLVLRFDGDEEEDENTTGDPNVKLSRQEKTRRRHEADQVDECDIFVTRWRWGKAYVQAVKGDKTIGTLAWLFHVQSTGILARPLDQLLHYPVPKRPIEAFANHTITVTNYTGEAREYLKKLITAMGAKFTPSMSGQNTALIAAYVSGTKANKALSWSIPVVNHTWLEDCFIQWRNLTVGREKYIVFPAGVDFSELLGERGLAAGASSGAGVASRIELEGEALEELIGEEGEEDVDGEEEVMKPPNGTEGSAREVARGLVEVDEDGDALMAPASKPNSKPTSKPKSNGLAPIRPPPGMDVDFAPPSTALAAAEMDWEQSHIDDVDQDDQQPLPSSPPGAEEDEQPKLKATPKAKPGPKSKAQDKGKAKESPRKPTYQPSKAKPPVKAKADVVELDDSSEEEDAHKKGKAKGKTTSEDGQNEEEQLKSKSKLKGRNKVLESEEETRPIARPKPTPKSKSKVIESSDNEEAPRTKFKAKGKVKALESDEEDQDQDEAPKGKSKGQNKAKVVSSDEEVEDLAVKPRSKPTPKSKSKKGAESEEEPITTIKSRPKPVPKTKSKATPLSEEEEEPVVAKARAKPIAKGKGKVADESEEEDEEVPPKSTSKSRAKPSPKSKSKFIDDAADDDEDDDDEEEEEEQPKTKSKTTAASKTKAKTKSKVPTPDPSASEASEDETPSRKPTKASAKVSASSKPALGKGKNKKLPSTSGSESEPAVVVPAKKPKKLVRRFTGELGGSKAKGGDDEAGVKQKQKADDKEKEVEKKETASSLLKTARGDARTRVKKRKEKPVVDVESDEEERVVVESKSKDKGQVAEKTKDAKGKKKPPVVSSDEEEEAAPAKSKGKGKAATTDKAKGKTAPNTPSRSKPLRVYSTNEECSDEEEEEEAQPTAVKKGKKAILVEEDGDDFLPDAPWLSAKGPKDKEKAGSSSKGKPAKGKAKVASDDEVEAAPAKKGSTSKAKKGAKEPVAPPTTTMTPKRTVSVLMPSLSMSGKEREKRKRAAEALLAGQEEDREEEARAGKKAKAASKPKSKATEARATTAAAKGKVAAAKGKNKAKTPIEPESEDEEEEAEVSVLVSPNSRATNGKKLGRMDSLHAVAGHIVSAAPAKAGVKEKTKTNGRAAKEKEKEETSISVSRKPSTSKSKLKPVPIDVDTSSAGAGPSTAGPSATPFETESVVSTAPPQRGAAARATQKLHDKLMPDLVNFEAQMKKSRGRKSAGGGNAGLGAFAFDGDGDAIKQEKDSGKRRKADGTDGEEETARKKRRVSDENEEVEKTKGKGKQKAGVDKDGDVEMVDADGAQPSKTAKGKKKEETEDNGSSSIVLLTTQVTLSEEVSKALGKLGVKTTSRPSECTHLLAPHLVRTEKFLCALAVAPIVMTGQWATASAAAKKLLPEKDFLLKDKAGENKYGVDLALSLKRAKTNAGKLLDGKTFYVTPRVQIDKKLLKSVVSACGGQLSSQTPTARIISPNPDTRIVISCKEDISIWRAIRAAGYKVYTQELVLDGVMKQEMEWDREDFLVEG